MSNQSNFSAIGALQATVGIGQYIVNDYVLTLEPLETGDGYTLTIRKGSDVQTVTLEGLSEENLEIFRGYVAAAQAAQLAAEGAQTAAETAQGKAEDAQDAAEAAQSLAETAQAAAETAETNAGASATQAGTSASSAAQSATQAAGSAAAAAQTLTDVQAAGQAQIAAIGAEGERVLETIPADYTELSGDVSNLKTEITYLENCVTPEMYGAVGDGETDDKTAIEAAFAAAYAASKTLYFPNKSYYSSAPIIIESVPDLAMDGTIVFANTGNGLTLGKAGVVLSNKQLRVNASCEAQTTGSNYFGLKIINAQNCAIGINQIHGFCVGVILSGDGKGFAYNRLSVNYIESIDKSLVILPENSGYTNENIFIGGRYVQRTSGSDIAITVNGNQNIFLGPCVELAYICFDFFGRQNNVIQCRAEGSTYVAKFEDNTYYNEVEVGYGSFAYLGYLDWNSITYNVIGDEESRAVNDRIVTTYPNTVFDCGYLASMVTIGAGSYDGAVAEPLLWLDANSRGLRRDYISISKLSKSGTEFVFADTGCIGVMVDCSIAKEFMLLQNGTKTGYWTIKLFGADGTQLDMSEMSIGYHTTYSSTWGGILYHGTYPISMITLPAEAKKAYIGISRKTGGTSLLTFAIKSKNMSVVLPE